MTQPTSDDCPRANGMPMLGLGTWKNEDPDQCAESVRTALETGYRHIDTADLYGNEAAVGDGVRQADVDREDVFLATKLWTDDLGYEDAIASAEERLDTLGVDYLDLLYIHWPAKSYDPEETFRAFEELHDRGLIENVGISNFEPEGMETAIEHCDVPILANQVECHPFLPQEDVRATAADLDIEVVAYSPLARGAVFESEALTDIADAHDGSAAQVSLAWLLDKGVTPIPKATSREHIEDNWRALALELSDEEIDRIDAIEAVDRKIDPDFGPWN